MIPIEMLRKYEMSEKENYLTEYDFYNTFLQQTNHIPAETFEAFIETMVEENVNMGNMKKFFNDIEADHREVLKARKFAREEINRIKAEQATE